MPRERIALEPAFVLHHREYRDTSRILDVFTARHGRLTLFARGARGPKSKLASLLMPFRPLLVSWSGRGDAAQLTAAEAHGEALDLAATPGALGLLPQRAHHQSDDAPRSAAAAVRATIHQALRQPAQRTPAPEPALRVFEKRLLESIGYGLDVRRRPEGLLSIPADAGRRRSARRAPGRLLGPLPAGAANRKAWTTARRSMSRGACCARRSIIVWKAASCARARLRARCRGEEMHEAPFRISSSASTSITWRRCGRRAARRIRIRCMPRCSPSRPAPTTSRCTCAKTAGTSRIATCTRCGRCCRRA